MAGRTPDRIRAALSEIVRDEDMNDGILAMEGRSKEFDTSMEARLTGIFLNDLARDYLDDELDKYWADTTVPSTAPEIVVGSGLHAAIYCSVRVAMGHPKPLVIEAKERVGGAFAVSLQPGFYLNSRNRPGSLGIPGREEALNYLPGAPVQPSNLGGEEYQTNAALAYSIRMSLVMNAKVLTGHKVMDATSTSVTLDDGRVIRAPRVIFATGLGEPKLPDMADGKHMIDAMEFLSRMDEPFPFRGLKSVAVVGCGDSGRTVVEALLGQGPTTRWSVAALDYVDRIDWYGVPETCLTKNNWEARNRSRYKGIARAMPVNLGEGSLSSARIKPIINVAETPAVGFDGAYIGGARYDLVIWAGGFIPMDVANTYEFFARGRKVARVRQDGCFIVGPAAQLPPEAEQNNTSGNVPENTVALFRYADRTAAFAMDLPRLELPKEEESPSPSISIREPNINRVRRLMENDSLIFSERESEAER